MTDDQMLAASGNASWMLMSAALVLLMTPALALFYGGMTGRRSAVNMMMMSFGTLGVVSIVYILWGWSMSYGTQSVAGVFANPFEMFGLSGQITDDAGAYVQGESGYANVIDIGFQLTFAVISTAIISGALAGRVKFSTWLVFSGLWATFCYFPLAHMVWGGGLLAHTEGSLAAMMFGLTDGEATVAPIDFAGGTVVHISAGTAALVLALIVGKRYDFMKSQARPHNLPLVMLGAAMLWFGWFGFNGGSAIAADGLAGMAWLNTTAATAAAMIGWIVVESIRDKRATSLGAASGVVAGLWGTIGLAFFASEGGMLTDDFGFGFQLLIVQVVIALVAMVFTAVVTAILGYILKAVMGWRIDSDSEESGIDEAQHHESSYDFENPEEGATPVHAGAAPKRVGPVEDEV
ncbi:MAG: ammonium transporter [Corynebacterium camporealensis]|uniref:ammonium transporter n=1 Tax=Corynebacterium camporealensis TaxID=161896 RepID=UPI002A91DDEE|nr:ammonium transporter [Corynebacterium camporealensis]MDY5841215.1 ammonium transporter [Corynebacterium camporealensis]